MFFLHNEIFFKYYISKNVLKYMYFIIFWVIFIWRINSEGQTMNYYYYFTYLHKLQL